MTNQEILEKIADKAAANGLQLKQPKYLLLIGDLDSPGVLHQVLNEAIIFDHDFAKAYFGEGSTTLVSKSSGAYCVEDKTHTAWIKTDAWKLHIQLLALTPPEERLSYLERYL